MQACTGECGTGQVRARQDHDGQHNVGLQVIRKIGIVAAARGNRVLDRIDYETVGILIRSGMDLRCHQGGQKKRCDAACGKDTGDQLERDIFILIISVPFFHRLTRNGVPAHFIDN